MRIYFTRHGETELNSKNLISGAGDIELSKKGCEQAASLAEDIAKNHRDIDVIIASPMKRAKKTAEYISAATGTDILTDSRLKEWDYGSYEGKPRNAEGFLEHKLEFGCRMPNGGESVFDLVSRVYGLLDEVREAYKDKNVLLVCHGGVCRVIETYHRDMTVKEFSEFFMGNCELRMFEI